MGYTDIINEKYIIQKLVSTILSGEKKVFLIEQSVLHDNDFSTGLYRVITKKRIKLVEGKWVKNCCLKVLGSQYRQTISFFFFN